jgi:predicted transposase YbfD/YdcC
LQTLFFDADKANFIGIDADKYETIEKSRGRVEERYCTVIDASELLETSEWAGLKTAARITRRRNESGKVSEETVYYISDLELDACKIGKAVREHWGVENGLHHALDVVFQEDSHIYRDRNGASNLSSLRKIALIALEKVETKKKRSKKTKRLLAAIDPEFRSNVLRFIF